MSLDNFAFLFRSFDLKMISNLKFFASLNRFSSLGTLDSSLQQKTKKFVFLFPPLLFINLITHKKINQIKKKKQKKSKKSKKNQKKKKKKKTEILPIFSFF